MIRFAHPEYLQFLWGGLLLIILYIWMRRNQSKNLAKLGDSPLILQLMPMRSTAKSVTKFIFILIGFIWLIVGIANPQTGSKPQKIKRQGVDIVIAMDISKSMLAQDLKPSRIERTKQFISKLLDKLAQDRMAFIVFAGNAYMQMPLTYDHSAAKLFLNGINTDLAPTQGTAIADAIELGRSSFKKDSKASKVMIVLSDGEDHEGSVSEQTKLAKEEGISIYTIGVGTLEGSPIPNMKNGFMQGFIKDTDGNVVMTKLDSKSLEEIASDTKAKYYSLGTSNDLIDAIENDLSTLKKGESEARIFTDYESQFYYFLAIGTFFLLIEFLISDNKSALWQRMSTYLTKPTKNQA